MKNYLGFILPLLSLIIAGGCSETAKDKEVNNNKEKALSDPEAVVVKFYNWYRDSIYENEKVTTSHAGPDVIIRKDSTYDIESTYYISFLKNSGFFSNSFIENENKRIENCRVKIQKVNAGNRKNTAGTTPYDKIPECTFLLFDNFAGGAGEDIEEEIKIIHSKINGNNAEVETNIGKLLPRILVTLEKEGTEWKINKVEELSME